MSEVVLHHSPEETEACTRPSCDDGLAGQVADLPCCLENLGDHAGELSPEIVRLEQELERIGATYGIPLVGLSKVSRLNPPAWLIDRLIPEKSLVFVYGEPGSGKTCSPI